MIKFKIEGVSHLTDRLKAVKESVRNKWLRLAVAKASRIARKEIRSRITTGKSGWEPTRAYVKSITVKIKNYGDGKIIGIVGPDRSVAVEVRTRQADATGKAKGKKGEKVLHRPANIAHLIEFGHGGPSPAPAHPAFRPGWEAAREPALAAIRDTLEQGLVKALA